MNGFKTRRLTESAIMIALAAVLSLVKVFEMPLGGSITAASMVPIIFVALRYGTRWGVLVAVTSSVMQMMESFWAPPTKTIWAFIAVILLDYVIAFGVLGLAPKFAKAFKGKIVSGAIFATICVCALRFVCHFTSGMIIWHTGDPAISDWVWSLSYNGSFMIPETIISAVVIGFLMKFVKLPVIQK